MPTAKDVAELSARVEALSAAVAKLSKSPKAAPVKAAAKAPATKAAAKAPAKKTVAKRAPARKASANTTAA